MIHLTQAAANEIRRLQASRQKIGSYFRLGVQTGGCSGLYYILDFCDTPHSGDRTYESQSISILVDEKSDSYLKDLKLDFAEDLMGGSFRFQNPNAASTCGCALSFSCAV
ncbi:Iron-sulfur cluster assembly accessory protein [Pleurocapsa sp. PCC 7327]|uniref:HesB/IscA family protein n=1 Tax=Pleurocapsa sp. PCC 7327 TaxID=118163 RepID=UPI00029FF816|nr:iron-sulfur cluster assembly accessory protein [Pleurocapsa sp. PCC 7327]AFY77934.1 Iron-sulfur cluster assembly accessory protein [Pleurocapsa sp. PCC 7327]